MNPRPAYRACTPPHVGDPLILLPATITPIGEPNCRWIVTISITGAGDTATEQQCLDEPALGSGAVARGDAGGMALQSSIAERSR